MMIGVPCTEGEVSMFFLKGMREQKDFTESGVPGKPALKIIEYVGHPQIRHAPFKDT